MARRNTEQDLQARKLLQTGTAGRTNNSATGEEVPVIGARDFTRMHRWRSPRKVKLGLQPTEL
jgi:hypothetical protein